MCEKRLRKEEYSFACRSSEGAKNGPEELRGLSSSLMDAQGKMNINRQHIKYISHLF